VGVSAIRKSSHKVAPAILLTLSCFGAILRRRRTAEFTERPKKKQQINRPKSKQRERGTKARAKQQQSTSTSEERAQSKARNT